MPRPVPLWRDPVLATLAVAGTALLGWYALDVAAPRTQLVVCWLIAPVMDLLLFHLSRRVWTADGVSRANRRFWRAVGAAGLIFAVGDTALLVTVLGDPSLRSSVAHPLQTVTALTGVILVYAVGLAHPISNWRRSERVTFLLDAAIIVSAAAAVAWCVMTRPSMAAMGDAEFVAALAGSGLMFCGILLAVKLALSGDSPMIGAAALPIGVSLVLQAAATVLLPGGAAGEVWLQMILAVSPCVITAAAPRIQELRQRAGSPEQPVRANPRRRYSVLPYAASVVCAATLVAALLAGGLGLPAWGALVALLLNVALVVARQVLALADNNRLLQRLDERERRTESMLRHSSEITSIISTEGLFRYVSPALEKVLGIPAAAAIGRSAAEVMHPDDEQRLAADMAELYAAPGTRLAFEGRYRRADGTWRWLQVVAVNLSRDPAIGGVVSNARDITESRELHELLRFQAGHDDLTGLANRREFTAAMLAAAGPDGTGRAAVLLIDLNGFKQINDTYGHSAGDAVLRHVSDRLRSCAGPGDLPARLGGDEFAVLAGGDLAGAERLAGCLRSALAAPVPVAGRELVVGLSIGVATGPAADPDHLLHAADLRMYDEKQRLRAVPS